MPHGPSPEQMLMRAVGINPAGNPARQSESSLPLDLDAMAKLLSSGVKPDACRDRSGTTALGVAAFLGRIEAMKLLLEHGANVEAENLDGARPLHFCLKQPATAALLLAAGADHLSAADDASAMGDHVVRELFVAVSRGASHPLLLAARSQLEGLEVVASNGTPVR